MQAPYLHRVPFDYLPCKTQLTKRVPKEGSPALTQPLAACVSNFPCDNPNFTLS